MSVEAAIHLPESFGDYELLERIGVGATAEVYRARTVGPYGFEKHVVLKRILPELAHDRALLEQLSREARVASVLQHGNIVHVFDFGEVHGQYYMAMELVEGRDLHWLLRTCARQRIAIPIELALLLVSELCKALDYAHTATATDGRPLKLVHRDVSPANVLISFDGDVKLMDFGVALSDLGSKESPPGAARASRRAKLGYMSPESVQGKSVDHRSDIFALGVILYEALTLKRLFVGRSKQETLENIVRADVASRLARHAIPGPVAGIIRRATARSPLRRFQRSADLQEALLDVLFGQGLRTTSRSLGEFIRTVAERAGESTEKLPPPPPALRPAQPVTRPRSTPRPRPPEPGLRDSSFHLRKETIGQSSLIGPITYENLTDLFRSHAIGPQELVRAEDGSWDTVENLLGLSGLAEELDKALARPLWRAAITRFSVPKTFIDIGRSRSDGRLEATVGLDIKEVWFERGAPVHVSSNLRGELLGGYLLRKGTINEHQLIVAAKAVRGESSFIGDGLMKTGAVGPNRLFQLLEDHMRYGLLELFRVREGEMAWFDNEAPPDDAPRMGRDALHTVTEGLRTRYDLETLWRYFDTRGDLEVHRRIVPGLSHNHLRFDPQELRVFGRLDYGATVRELERCYGRRSEDKEVLLRVLALLHMTGLIELRG